MDVLQPTAEQGHRLESIMGVKAGTDTPVMILLRTQDEIDQLFGVLNHSWIQFANIPILNKLYDFLKRRSTKNSDKYFNRLNELLIFRIDQASKKK